MTLKYFKDQIHEELMGAREYIEKAIEVKPNHRVWSITFAKMADMEASHAANLMKMLEECIQKKDFTDSTEMDSAGMMAANDPDVVYKDLMKEFGETMTYVENMKRGL
jgi:hypothetical protein